MNRINLELKVLTKYSEIVYSRKPNRSRILSKVKASKNLEKDVSERDTEIKENLHLEEEDFRTETIEIEALEILEEDQEEQEEVNELLEFLKNKNKDRFQKAKIFYKNLKFNFNLLDIVGEDEENKKLISGKKMRRIETRVMKQVYDKYNNNN